jgi:CRP/FNR family transcriptional regulator, anaerobic regulatory protein
MNTATAMSDSRLSAEGAWYLRSEPSAQGSACDLLRLMGVPFDDPHIADDVSVSTRRVRAGGTLFHEGAPAQAIYFVAVGTFKCLHIAEDGYEQVLGFAGRTEVMGYDAVCNGHHPTTAIALEDSTVHALALPDMFALCQRVPALDRVVHLALSRQLVHQVEIANLMAAVAAEVRLARFLVQLSERMAERGQSPRRLLLRMSRRDIASHLGVAHETVSRSFSTLAHCGCLAVCNREVEIIDLERLKACASNTRGLSDAHFPRSHAALAHPQAACA